MQWVGTVRNATVDNYLRKPRYPIFSGHCHRGDSQFILFACLQTQLFRPDSE